MEHSRREGGGTLDELAAFESGSGADKSGQATTMPETVGIITPMK